MKTAILSIDADLRESNGTYGYLSNLKIGSMTLSTPDDSFIIVTRDFFGDKTAEEFIDSLDGITMPTMPKDMSVVMEIAESEISMIQRMFKHIHFQEIKRVVIWNTTFDVQVILSVIERSNLKPEDVLSSDTDNNKIVYFHSGESTTKGIPIAPADRRVVFVAGSEVQYIGGMRLARLQPFSSREKSYVMQKLVKRYTFFKNPIVFPEDILVNNTLSWHGEMQKKHIVTYLAHGLFTVYSFFELDKALHLTTKVHVDSLDSQLQIAELGGELKGKSFPIGRVYQNYTYQERVGQWMRDTFEQELCDSFAERHRRLLEETLELAQSLGGTKEEALAMVEYVYNRDIGVPNQEVGGVVVTLACLCEAAKIDMLGEGEIELERIWKNQEKIRAKNASKPSSVAVKLNQKEKIMYVHDNKALYYAEQMRKLIESAAKEGVVLIPEMERYIYPSKPNLTEPYRSGVSIGVANEVRHPFFSTISRINAYAIMSTNKESGDVEVYVPDVKWPEDSLDEDNSGLETTALGSAEVVNYHIVDGDDNPVKLFAVGERNAANAHNSYVISGLTSIDGKENKTVQQIDFQNGNPLTQGYNGWVIEQLLAACLHRLQGYQLGKFACEDNQNALEHIEQAIRHLNRRTVDRIARQVKNTDNT